jgi:hypothetical protein
MMRVIVECWLGLLGAGLALGIVALSAAVVRSIKDRKSKP